MLQPWTVETFGGLNLAPDPLEVGATGAVDLLNVWLEPGRVQTVPTVASFATATRAVLRLFTHGTGTQLIASEGDGTNVTLEAFNLVGTSLATTTYASTDIRPHSFATIGTPAATRTYAIRDGDTTRKWDGSAWSTVAAVPAAGCCSPTYDGRMAVAATVSNVGRVHFSDAGDPETWGANNFVDLAPGDGETIGAMVAWQGSLFAFKNSKFAVFYGTSTDSDGLPIFNYRMVEGKGIGLKGLGYPGGGACAARDGVYFVADDGVYRTQGGPPVLVSRAITPLWHGQEPAAHTTVPQLSLSGYFSIEAVRDSVFLSIGASSPQSQMTLVLRDGQWTYLNVQANSTNTSAANVVDLRSKPTFALAGSTAIKQFNAADGPDTAASWSWKSGRYPLSDPGRVAVTNESSLVGFGTVTLRLDSDLYSNQSGSATLGTEPAVAEGWPTNVDQEGTWIQHTLSGTGSAQVSRLTHHVSFVRPAGVR